LRRQSERLLDAAKRAVELAIENGETSTIAWLKTQTEGQICVTDNSRAINRFQGIS
jgi:hypothetical protein